MNMDNTQNQHQNSMNNGKQNNYFFTYTYSSNNGRH